ncbi:OstA-like protein [Bacteroides heparinolyticus]|uniref:OstA-like protein n=2 Tax=Prevotella heparinolytica TaxID=28113 RepID=A0A4R2LKJ2_9BACE|nr:OstA-like protein [Bacteroides heparinolyticus]TCO91100.1 OstA-like protein [Bacteroides heparinolyticus]
MQRKYIRTHFLNKHRYLLIGILCLFGICLLSAQDKKTKTATSKNKVVATDKQQAPAAGKQKTRVDLLYADEAQADKLSRPDVQILVGSVRLKHDSMYMFCDSALIFEKINSVEAFGNVRMEQGDTLFIYGDYLYYDGMSQLAILRENVRMINRKTELTTDSLNYDRLYNLGYYFEGGTLTDEENVLTSEWGEYSPTTKLAVFNHDVKLVNPKFVLTSDTLKYSTETKVATILGPSDIVSEQNHIYSERGVYNTITEQAELLDRSILTNEGKKLTGDSLFYDRKLGYGEAFDNVQMNDTVNRNMLTGDYCFYNELTGNAVATQRAMAVDYSQGDSLFMHADTLRLITYHLNTDSMYREMRAYHKVRAYRTDVQAVCDSLVYNSKDSCMTMYTDPILWHGEQQLLGEEIKVYMNDSTIDWAHIIRQALTVEKMDSIHYNQVSGKEMKAFFIDGDMRRVEVNGNVLVVYYPVEEKDSSLIMMNYSEGGLLKIYLKDRKMERGVFVGKTTGTAYPLDQIPAEKSKLPSFVWFDYIRPKNKEDIFEWRGKKAGEALKKSDRKPVISPRNMHIKRNKK